MKLLLIETYESQQKTIAKNEISKTEKLKKHIEIAKQCLSELRIYVRNDPFETLDEEIKFFKFIKPKILADYTFYKRQLWFEIKKPHGSVDLQKRYIKIELKKLENIKKSILEFFTYYKQGATVLDKQYFLRGNEQLALFNQDLVSSSDPEFYTSHSLKASQVLSYDLLTNFFKKELLNIKRIQGGYFNIQHKEVQGVKINWTGSKTDLIELIYALKVSGAIDGGRGNINQISKVFSDIFDIDLGNFYKTYAEIKIRSKERTKFLNKLKDSLEAKLDFDDGL